MPHDVSPCLNPGRLTDYVRRNRESRALVSHCGGNDARLFAARSFSHQSNISDKQKTENGELNSSASNQPSKLFAEVKIRLLCCRDGVKIEHLHSWAGKIRDGIG